MKIRVKLSKSLSVYFGTNVHRTLHSVELKKYANGIGVEITGFLEHDSSATEGC